MSRVPEEPGVPRRPRPKAARPEGSSTFRPNPNAGRARAVRNDSRDLEDEQRVAKPGQAIVFGRVNSGTLALFCRQFASYLDAGVDLLKSLSNLETQYARTALGPIIGRIALSVRRGDSMTDAVKREPKAFDSLFVSMIQVAEARGGMPETLRMLSRHYEARQRLIRQARSAMIYPVAVLLVASAVVAMLTLWLLPKFIDMLQEVAGRGATLPLPSRVLMAFSGFVQTLGWWLIPLVMIGGPLLLLWIYKTQPGKRILDNLIIRVPVFGLLLRKIDTTRFARTLGTLLGSGVDVGSSIDLTGEVMRLEPLRRAVLGTRPYIMDGGPLSEALQESRWFGPDVVAVIESGEETGKLPESLERLADDYEEQVSYMVRNMGQLVQPLIMIFLGGLVLFIILAILLPYLALLANLSGAH
jgi:type II secretory pathway component PulF